MLNLSVRLADVVPIGHCRGLYRVGDEEQGDVSVCFLGSLSIEHQQRSAEHSPLMSKT
jgi:hypothetical protein